MIIELTPCKQPDDISLPKIIMVPTSDKEKVDDKDYMVQS